MCRTNLFMVNQKEYVQGNSLDMCCKTGANSLRLYSAFTLWCRIVAVLPTKGDESKC
jgi:hypothetical protein